MKPPLIHFEEKGKDHRNEIIYWVYNHEEVFLGTITKTRVGRFLHWIFSPDNQTYFTNGCLKEIVAFITKLYSKKKK